MLRFTERLAAGIAIFAQAAVQIITVGPNWIAVLAIGAVMAAVAFLVAAVLMCCRPGLSARISRWATLVAMTFYVPAFAIATFNIVHRGSTYPLQLFVPPALLAIVALGFRHDRQQSRVRALPAFAVAAVLLVVVPIVSAGWPVPSTFFRARKVVTLQASWIRGDVMYGRNYVELRTTNGTHRCAITFVPRADFADYVTSFGNRSVPVTYEVFYDEMGEAVSANLVRVGVWSRRRFGENDGSIGPYGAVGLGGSLRLRAPQDCFHRIPPGFV